MDFQPFNFFQWTALLYIVVTSQQDYILCAEHWACTIHLETMETLRQRLLLKSVIAARYPRWPEKKTQEHALFVVVAKK